MEGVKGRYSRIVLDLSSAKTNEELAISGDYIGVVGITSTGSVKIRLDHRHSQEINLREVAEITSPFNRIYFTTDGTGGQAVLYVGGALTARIKPLEQKVSIRNIAGSDVDLVENKRFTAHVGGHLKATLNTLDTAQQLTTTSIKVKWAIISSKDYPFRWGFTDTVKQSTSIGQYVGAESFLTVEYCNLNEIYFVDGDGANKPVLQVEYVLEA